MQFIKFFQNDEHYVVGQSEENKIFKKVFQHRSYVKIDF